MATLLAELLRLPITFGAADGSTVHSPLVAATVGGVETLLVLDTGSDVHLLTIEIAERSGLALTQGEEGTDHSGASLPSWSAGDIAMRAGGSELELRDVVVVPPPPPFPGRGIGGILSPQHLVPDAGVVLNLAGDELLLVDAPAGDVAAWLAERSPDATTLLLERDGKTATPVVQAAIEPFAETNTMLNTGGRRTEFDATAVPGLAGGDPERLGGGVSGADVVGALTGDRMLAVAGARIPLQSLAVRREMGYPPAMIGMDVLRGTVLALDADPAGRVTWQLGRGA
jgi:hypothetical protein